MANMYWSLTVCLVVLCIQGALSQDDSDGNSESSCPPLKLKALRIVCTSADGDEQDCNQPEAGTKAKIQWKKNSVQGSGQVTDVVCKDSGVWRREKSFKMGLPSGGRKSGGDSDEDSIGSSRSTSRRAGVSG